MDKEMIEKYLQEIKREEERIIDLELIRSYFEDYDKKLDPSKKELKSDGIFYSILIAGYSFYLKDIKSVLISGGFLTLLSFIKFGITNYKDIKTVRQNDIEDVVMQIYDARERSKGMRRAIYREINSNKSNKEEKAKVFLKK